MTEKSKVMSDLRSQDVPVQGADAVRTGACECGHPLSGHAASGWGPNTVCVEVLDDPSAGWYGVCPCVRHEAAS